MDQTDHKGFEGPCLHRLDNPTRTEGDGMENVETGNSEKELPVQVKISHSKKLDCLRDKLIYNPDDLKNVATKPPRISGKIIQIRPAPIIVKAHKHDDKFVYLKSKEPKFVPYEPYKGAVNPMVPQDMIIRKKKTKKLSTSSLPEPRSSPEPKSSLLKPEELKIQQEAFSENTVVKTSPSLCLKNDTLEKELERLQKENQQLENQLKFQVQVNGDLKNLLVASVGEDMETRVHILTEDKLHLARALLNSAQKLNTHQEQKEWLAGQCEVWRSKFLASSIMVEELAKWKALLTRRVQDLQDTIKQLLDERVKVREYLISTYKDLGVLCDSFDVTSLRNGIHKLNSSNILDLSEMNMQLTAVVRLQLLGNGMVPSNPEDPSHLSPRLTVAEASANELLKHPVPELENADAAYSAVMGAAVASSASSHLFSPACCGHCTGEIKTI